MCVSFTCKHIIYKRVYGICFVCYHIATTLQVSLCVTLYVMVMTDEVNGLSKRERKISIKYIFYIPTIQ